MSKLFRNQKEREAEQREIKRLKEGIVREIQRGGFFNPRIEAFVTKTGNIYSREFLEDYNLTRFIPEEYRGGNKKRNDTDTR